MKKIFLKLRTIGDRLLIWAILRLRIKLPDLQQTARPKPHRLYYYYGRWLRLVPHDRETSLWVRENINSHTAFGNDRVAEALRSHICSSCALFRIGLPCHKYQGATTEDLCLRYHYHLVKGKEGEQV